MKKTNMIATKISEFVEKNYKIVFSLVLLLAVVINTYKLGEIPDEIHVDEAGMTYDAYCIANYGVDRFEKRNPVYFINFGGGQNALYTYLTSILIKTVGGGGYNSLIIRLPAFIISILEIIVCYFLVKEFFTKKHALLFMFLVTIAPWHIMKSRWGLESFLLSPLFLFSIFTLVKAVKSLKYRLLLFSTSGLLFGITLYTYAISYITVPVFLILMGIYLIIAKQIRLKDVIFFSVPLVVLGLPLILVQFVQKGWIPEINSFISMPKLFEYRSSEIKFDLKNLISLQYGLFCDYLGYNSLKGYGVLYYFGTVLMIVGLCWFIYNLVVKKIKHSEENQRIVDDDIISEKEILNLDIIMLLAFISNLIIGFLTHINSNVINGILISATYFEYVALREIFRKQKTVFLVLIFAYYLSFWLFVKSYFVEYPNQYKRFHDNGLIDVLGYVNERFENKEMYVDGKYNTYIYNLYVNPISPSEFNNSKEMKKNEVAGYKNYHAYWKEEPGNNSIYITNDVDKVKNLKLNSNPTVEIYKEYYIVVFE